MSNQMEIVKKGIDKVVDLMDENKDGKISADEARKFITDTKNIKFILYILLSILVGPFIEWISNSLSTGAWVPDGLFTFAQVIIPAIVLGYYFKGLLDIADKEKRELQKEILDLRTEINDMKIKYQGEIQQLQLTIKQMEGALKCKDVEIEWLNKGMFQRKE